MCLLQYRGGRIRGIAWAFASSKMFMGNQTTTYPSLLHSRTSSGDLWGPTGEAERSSIDIQIHHLLVLADEKLSPF